MSLTFKVSIPVESLEKLQSMSPFYDAVYGIFEKSDETATVLEVCKSVVAALDEMPYELKAKKPDGKDKFCSCEDGCRSSDGGTSASPFSYREDGEVDNESASYDEIHADEFDRRSTTSSVVAKDRDDAESTKDDNTEIYADESSEIGNDSFSKVDDEREKATLDAESVIEPNSRCSTPGYTLGENATLDPIHITVIVNKDGSGVSFRLSLNEVDTWSTLADKLRNMSSLFKGDLNFWFRYSFYDQHCQERLYQAGVSTDSVIYAQTDFRGHMPIPQMPLAWTGPYAYMKMPQPANMNPQQALPNYDFSKYEAEPKGASMNKTMAGGHAFR